MATTPRKSFIYSTGFGGRTIIHFIQVVVRSSATLLMLKNEFVIRKTRLVQRIHFFLEMSHGNMAFRDFVGR